MIAARQLIDDRAIFYEHPDDFREQKEYAWRGLRRDVADALIADLEASPNPVTCSVKKIERHNPACRATELVYQVETVPVRMMDVTMYRMPAVDPVALKAARDAERTSVRLPTPVAPQPELPTLAACWAAVKNHFRQMTAELEYDGPRG